MAGDPVFQPERAIVGLCPHCKRVIVVHNNHEVWPFIRCECGWSGQTDYIDSRVRYERGGYVES